MAGHTPNLGLWYPDGADPLSAGDDGIRENANLLDQGAGTVLHFVDEAARDAGLPAPTEGRLCTTDSGKVLERYTPPNGWTRLTPTALWMGTGGPSDAAGEIIVSFPAGIFTVPPFVTATIVQTDWPAIVWIRGAPSTTGFNARTNYTTDNVNWTPAAGFQIQFLALQLT